MAQLQSLQAGELSAEAIQAAAGAPIDVHYRGRSSDRHPSRAIVPHVSEILAAAAGEQALVRLHFEAIDHMNSSTITAIIQVIQEARTRATPLVIVFDPAKTWQKLSFEALSVFVKEDGLLKLEPGSPR